MIDVDRLHAPIAGEGLRLEPLAEAHRARLRSACAEDADVWAIYATSFDPDHFDASFDALLANPARLAFAIFDTHRLVGMSAYLGIDRQRAVAEIGNSYIIPAMRGTGFNARLKQAMLAHGFACGVRRMEFRVDARNGRSQAAVLKIGGVREGVIRADRITWTGHVRDTVLFSILAGEWPANG